MLQTEKTNALLSGLAGCLKARADVDQLCAHVGRRVTSRPVGGDRTEALEHGAARRLETRR
jgi:hypothetical protein